MRSRVRTRKKKADNPAGRMLWVVGGGRDEDESAQGRGRTPNTRVFERWPYPSKTVKNRRARVLTFYLKPEWVHQVQTRI